MTYPEPVPVAPDGGAVIGRPPIPPTLAGSPAPGGPAPAAEGGQVPSPLPLAPAAPWSTPGGRPALPPATPAMPVKPGSASQTAIQTVAYGAADATVVAASRTAGQRVEARAVPDTDQHGPPGPTNGRQPGNGHARPGVSGRLARLRIGSHLVSRSALTQLRLSSVGTGLILGADRQQGPVPVRFFRPEPTRVTLVGGSWAGQLVAFRALALGARLAVITADPQVWQGFGERATGRGDRVAVLTGERSLEFVATAQQPVLVVYDLGLAGPSVPLPLGPWQTQLTILRQLDVSAVALLQDCDLVLLQRLGTDEAAVAGKALRLPASSADFLQVMADEMVALVADGVDRYITFAQTELERHFSGSPRR